MAIRKIKIIDSLKDYYTLEPKELILGRRYDHLADEIRIERPSSEKDNSCVLIFADLSGSIIDIIDMEENSYKIKDSISQYENVTLCFSFSNDTGYRKGSEVILGKFQKSLKPYDFIPVEPERKTEIEKLLKNGVIDINWKEGTNNILEIKRLDDDDDIELNLSPFVQEQADLEETDVSHETFVKGKKTSNLKNDGEDGSSPYATQEFVEQHTPIIDLSNYYTKAETDEQISKIDVTDQLPTVTLLWEDV